MSCCRRLLKPPLVSAGPPLSPSASPLLTVPSVLKLMSSMMDQCRGDTGGSGCQLPLICPPNGVARPLPDTDRLIGFTSLNSFSSGGDKTVHAAKQLPTACPEASVSTIDDRPWQVPRTLAHASQTICVTPTALPTSILPAREQPKPSASRESAHGIFKSARYWLAGLVWSCLLVWGPSHPFWCYHTWNRRDDERGVPPSHLNPSNDMVGFPGFSLMGAPASARLLLLLSWPSFA